jgi:PAS domain S-box-containing protein
MVSDHGAEHERTEEVLRQSLATSQALLESASEGIVIIDGRGHIQVANASAERMFGYTRAELAGQSVEILLPERFRHVHADHRAGYFAAPRVRPMGQGMDLAALRKSGAEFPVEISLSYVNTEIGRFAMAFITDITARKRGEDELRRQRDALHQAEKLAALGTLAAGLAHEINNPIGIVSSRIELMLTESGGLPQGLREDLEVLQRNVQRVGQIAQGLLTFARQSPGERGPVDLNRVVRETLLLAERQMSRAGTRVRTTLDPALPSFVGDSGALQQVVLNLLTNAREALNGAGEVRIETCPALGHPGSIQLIVTDDGPGMPADVLPKIFDPFFTTKARGTGLGLSVSYGIVQEHGGTIEVRSEPGQGTVFVLTFPVDSSPSPPPDRRP